MEDPKYSIVTSDKNNKKKKNQTSFLENGCNFSTNHSSVKLDLKKTLFKTRNVASQRTPFGVVL